MARKSDLRVLHDGKILNNTSEKREGKAAAALNEVILHIVNKFSVKIEHERSWRLVDIVTRLRQLFPDVDFHVNFAESNMRPDGGILSMIANDHSRYPILITEVKNQGTNDLRLKEGKPRQAKGNAIERLGKNVIGFRTALLGETIFPFVCFGDGCDFAHDSSILDRVVTISMFGQLNKIRVHNEGKGGVFNRGSFFFREKLWSPTEMAKHMKAIAESAVYYYFSKYGESNFR